ncbi:hypothetical protein SAMN05519103_08727 [Rhizobiales bacterium GAS113]|nr:hypothetical protein SAMN05519103_08727 [Rhizobiales bacterium GAS113]
MKVGDRVKFRSTSTFWARHGLLTDAEGVIVMVRDGPEARKLIDVKFRKLPDAERGIDADELEVIDGGNDRNAR